MDWKEAGKWIAITAIGGVISTVLETVITRYVTATATAVAHEETERTILATAQRLQAQAPRPQTAAAPPQKPTEPLYTVI